MARDIDLMEYLPPVFGEIQEIKHLMQTDSEEVNLLWKAYEDLMNDQFVYDATENGIKRWEKILGIKPSASSTLEDRRWEVLNRLNVKIPYTMTMLKNKLSSMYGDNFSLKLISDTYTLQVRIPMSELKNIESVRNMLDVLVPANLYIDLDVDEKFKKKERKRK